MVEWSGIGYLKCYTDLIWGEFHRMDQDHVPECKSAIMTNGVVSEYFDISRGIRHGDAMSALLYIIQAEPLAEAIRQSNSIKGIDITNGAVVGELKIGQYVDDTIMFLRNSAYIRPCLNIVSEYEKVSGAKLNIKKPKGSSAETT